MGAGSISESEARAKRLALVLLAVLIGFRLITLQAIPLTGDEAYHWEWSRRLDWAYYDHPGMVAWILKAFTSVFGVNTFAARLPALICMAGSLAIFWRIASMTFKSEKIGLWVLAALGLSPLWQGMSMLITTDPPYILFSSVALLAGWMALVGGQRWAWLGFGLACGLAMNSKFLGGLHWPAIALAALLLPDGKKWFRRWEPYAGFILTLLVFSPVLLWNANHEWATFRFHSVVRQDSASFGTYLVRFLFGQPLVYGLILWPVCLVAVLRGGCWKELPGTRFLFAMASPLALMALLSLRSDVGLHWTSVQQFALLAAGVGIASMNGWAWRAARIGTYLNLGFALAINILLLAPTLMLNAEFRISHAKATSALDSLFGWSELGERLVQVRSKMDGEPLYLNNNYAYAAVASFYTPGNPMVWQFGDPSAYGRAYQFWMKRENWMGRDAIYFRDRPLKESTRRVLEQAFDLVEEEPPLDIYASGRRVRTWYVFRCYGFRKHPWHKYIENPMLR